MIGRAFGQGYFGGSPFTSTSIVSGGRPRALVMHLDGNVAVSGMASEATDFSFAVRTTSALITARVTNAVLPSRTTQVAIPARSTSAALVADTSDTTDFDWKVSP